MVAREQMREEERVFELRRLFASPPLVTEDNAFDLCGRYIANQEQLARILSVRETLGGRLPGDTFRKVCSVRKKQ